MTIQLVVHDSGRPVRKLPAADQMLLGRGPECALHLEEGTVSLRHARIVQVGSRFFVEDLGGKNRTLIEGGPALASGERAELRPGMTIVLGRARIGVEGSAGAHLDQTVMEQPGLEATLSPGSSPPAFDPGGEATLVPQGGEATLVPPPPPSPPPPTPAQRPPAMPREDPAPPPAGEDFDSNTLVPPKPDPGLAAHAFFEGCRPRLVLDNDACRKVVPIDRAIFAIGRSEGALALQHPRISRLHAQISYQPEMQRMFVEDMQSQHGTFLNGEALIANRPRELAQHAHLRFDTIDALFLMERDYSGEALQADERRRLAVEMLLKAKKLDAAAKRAAETAAKQQSIPLEAALIVSGAVSVPTWVQALEEARIRLLVPDHTRGLKAVIFVLALIVLALAGFALWRLL